MEVEFIPVTIQISKKFGNGMGIGIVKTENTFGGLLVLGFDAEGTFAWDLLWYNLWRKR